MDETLFADLHLPLQDLSQLSFCGDKPSQIKKWLDALPTTETKHTGIIFYKLLPEINRLNIKTAQKISILELLRPAVQECIEGLTRDFLEQTLALPEQSAKIAAVAQALQRHLGDNYISVCHRLAIKLSNSKHSLSDSAKKELALVVSRSLFSLGQLLYRNHQLYIPQTSAFWHKLHYLQQIIIQHELEDVSIEDPLLNTLQSHRIRDSFIRPILLNCSHTNQLNQRDIAYLYQLLESWCCQAELIPARTTDADSPSCLYWINLSSHQGPMYKHRFTNTDDDTLAIDLSRLNSALNTIDTQEVSANTEPKIPLYSQQQLVNHLSYCWQTVKERHEERTETHSNIEICIGLCAAHAQLSQGLSFDEFIRASGDKSEPTTLLNDHTNTTNCHSISPHRYNAIIGHSTTKKSTVTAMDISHHGYCIKWDSNKSTPQQIKNGELVIIKPEDQQHWEAGIIRWVQRLNNDSYIGIEKLSKKIKACAISTTLSNGQESPFFRAIQLVEHETLKEKRSLNSILIPRIPFSEHQKVSLNQYGQQSTAQLTHKLSTSEYISHYQYCLLPEQTA